MIKIDINACVIQTLHICSVGALCGISHQFSSLLLFLRIKGLLLKMVENVLLYF